MNRIEELHAQVRNDLREKRPGEYITDAEVGAAFGSVTVDIAIRFAEWIVTNKWTEYESGKWIQCLSEDLTDGCSGPVLTTAEIFNSDEFQKTI